MKKMYYYIICTPLSTLLIIGYLKLILELNYGLFMDIILLSISFLISLGLVVLTSLSIDFSEKKEMKETDIEKFRTNISYKIFFKKSFITVEAFIGCLLAFFLCITILFYEYNDVYFNILMAMVSNIIILTIFFGLYYIFLFKNDTFNYIGLDKNQIVSANNNVSFKNIVNNFEFGNIAQIRKIDRRECKTNILFNRFEADNLYYEISLKKSELITVFSKPIVFSKIKTEEIETNKVIIAISNNEYREFISHISRFDIVMI